MSAVFADTFYWPAALNAEHSAHLRALEFSRTLRPDRIVPTDEVLSEFLTFFSRMPSKIRRRAGDTAATLLTSQRVVVVAQSRETFLAGLELYRARADKGYSLTDRSSMQIMRKEGLSDVLTNDRHFEQEGFRALFR